jgi:hypothetical protein
MTTPEGRIKAKVRAVLDRPEIWSFWPVPSGYQAATLDVLCAIEDRFSGLEGGIARFFAIECKRHGKTLTERQKGERARMKAVGAEVFRVNSDEEVEALRAWIEKQLA